MKAKCRLLGLLAVCVAGAFAMSGAAAGSASAVTDCVRVAPGEPSTFAKRSAAGKCEGSQAESGWVEVEGTGEPVGTVAEAGLLCYKVKTGVKSMFKNSKCTELEDSGTGKYVRVVGCLLFTAITGQGSSLQKISQELWIAGSGCSVKYESTGSGAGRTAWGAEEAGHKPNDGTKKNPAESGDAFIGSDEPLNAAQIKNLDEAAGGTGQTIVIPVAQAAIAVIVNPPAECTITKITNANLLAAWTGTKTKWSEIGGTGTGCTGSITRVVRKDVSGTTYVFKTYLAEINMAGSFCGMTLLELAVPAENLTWPENGQAGCTGLSTVVHATNSGGGGEAEEVLAKSGSIGYANLGDARAKYNKEVGNHYHWIKIENETTKEFVNPGTSAGEPTETVGEANCAETHYTNKPAYGADDNWSEVGGAHPKGNVNYPICTLTYDVALGNYELAGFKKPEEEGMTTMEYMEYVTSPSGGQAAFKKHDYREVEEAVGTLAQEEAKLVNLRPV